MVNMFFFGLFTYDLFIYFYLTCKILMYKIPYISEVLANIWDIYILNNWSFYEEAIVCTSGFNGGTLSSKLLEECRHCWKEICK